MARSRPLMHRSQVEKTKSRPRARNPLEEVDEIQEFWGQLWLFPTSKTTSRNPKAGRACEENLVWVQRDLWEAKTFSLEDCFPVSERDVWDSTLKKLSFASSIWGEGQRASFAQVVKSGMANQGHGRGPRPRNPEEDWGIGEGEVGASTATLHLHSRRSRSPSSTSHHPHSIWFLPQSVPTPPTTAI